MKLKFKYFILQLLISVVALSQTENEKTINKFYSLDIKGKVKFAAALPSNNLKEIYPRIKDTLEHLKKLIYYKSSSNEGRMLFDIIDARLAEGNQNYSKAIFILKNGMQNHASNLHDSLLCLSHLKNYYVKTTNYIRAYEVNTKMENLWKRKADSVKIDFGINKSALYSLLNLIPDAIRERRNEFLKMSNKNDTNALAGFYNDIGVYYNRIKNSDSAEVYFEKAKELLEHKKVPAEKVIFYEFFKALIGGNLGLSYFNKGNHEKAIPLLVQDIYFSKKHGDYMSAFNSHNLMVECYLLKGQKAIAKRHLDTAEVLLQSHLGDIAQRIKFILIKAKFYQAIDDNKQAIKYLNNYLLLKDSLADLEREQNLLNTEIAFKVEQKETELLEKNRIIEQKKLEEAKEKAFKAYSVAGIIFLIGLVVFLIMVNHLSKKREKELFQKNEQIKFQHSQIEQSLKEKELLIREVHHRVKNNLQIITSMLGLQISKVEGTDSEAILREAQQRIGSIALTHRMLYQNANLNNILINEYISNLVKQIKESFPPSNISLEITLSQNQYKLNIDSAVPLGLLINEVLTNAFKHAFPLGKKGHIKITLTENKDQYVLNISDDGIGLPDDFKLNDKKSMGMDLIHILAEQLDSKLIIERNNGTSFSLEIPINKFII